MSLPVDSVIAKFGSQSALAKLLGKRQSTVQHWSKSGVIPQKWHARLLELAAESGVDLGPQDLAAEAPQPQSQLVAVPVARWHGNMRYGELELPCYVLDDGRRVMSLTGAVSALTGNKASSGDLQSYIGAGSLADYMPADVEDQLIEFSIPGNPVIGRGMQAELFLDICRAYLRARNEEALKTKRQVEIAISAGTFLAACSKVGLIALIDEATGYQYEREEDALQVKLKLYLEDEMRKWEKTFPDELWREFGRLTNWEGALHARPKYWGKLVMELIYGYLDKDVADWLRENAPAPRHGQNYHQWLSSQYGLKKLIEHIWLTIGMASACTSMTELRERMANKFGRERVQLLLFVPPKRSQSAAQTRPVRPGNDG